TTPIIMVLREHCPPVIISPAVSVMVGLTVMLLLNARPLNLIALVIAILAGLALTKWLGKVSFYTAVAAHRHHSRAGLRPVAPPGLAARRRHHLSRVELKEHTIVQA